MGVEHDGHSGRGTSTARPARAYASTDMEQGHTMVTGGNTALDPSRQSYQLQREGSLAYKEPVILTAHTLPPPFPTGRAKTVAETPLRCSNSHTANTRRSAWNLGSDRQL